MQGSVAHPGRGGQATAGRTVGRGQVRANDLLLSTLRRYVESVGAHVTVVVHLADGKRVELDLEALTELALNAASTAARVRMSASGHRWL